ncbi:hypothetical protein CR513_26727, partial [Mucuna pruriens]
MERKELLHVDFSSYFRFEASGDSEEADCEIARTGGDDDHDNDNDNNNDNDDDALSCNYDGSGACNAAEFDGDKEESCDEEHDDDDDKKKEGDEEKSGVYGMSYCEDDEMQEEQMKSYVSFDSGQEMITCHPTNPLKAKSRVLPFWHMGSGQFVRIIIFGLKSHFLR